MIGTQKTGTIEGVVIYAVGTQGLQVEVDGKPARLAIVTDDGQIIASGPAVAREAEAVSINCYRELWKGRGHLRVVGTPIKPSGQH